MFTEEITHLLIIKVYHRSVLYDTDIRFEIRVASSSFLFAYAVLNGRLSDGVFSHHAVLYEVRYVIANLSIAFDFFFLEFPRLLPADAFTRFYFNPVILACIICQ